MRCGTDKISAMCAKGHHSSQAQITDPGFPLRLRLTTDDTREQRHTTSKRRLRGSSTTEQKTEERGCAPSRLASCLSLGLLSPRSLLHSDSDSDSDAPERNAPFPPLLPKSVRSVARARARPELLHLPSVALGVPHFALPASFPSIPFPLGVLRATSNE